MDRRRIGLGLFITTVFLLGSGMPVGAQSADDVTESLCKVFNRKQVREAFGRQVAASDQQPGMCYWGITNEGAYGAQLILDMAWLPVAFDDVPLTKPGWIESTVAGKRALFRTKAGQVLKARGGYEMRDIDSELVLDLAQGPLRLHLVDGKGRDRRGTLEQLGALAVAKDGGLVTPPTLDDVLVSAVPPVIDGWPSLVTAVPYPGAQMCAQCPSGKGLRSALKAQGKAMADVTMLTATGVDPENVIENAFRQPAVRAIRVADGDAMGLVEPVITHLFEGASAEPVRVDGEGITAVSRPADQYNFGWTAYVYPQGDTVWVVTTYGEVPTELVAALPGGPTAPDVPAPPPAVPTDPTALEAWAREVVPATIRGEPVRIGTSPLFDDGSDVVKRLKRELRKQDKSLDDVSAILAFTPSGYGLQGFRVAGGDASALLDVLLASVRQAGTIGDEELVAGVIGGKSVQTGTGPMGTTHVYPGGEVLWMIPGSEELASEWLAALP